MRRVLAGLFCAALVVGMASALPALGAPGLSAQVAKKCKKSKKAVAAKKKCKKKAPAPVALPPSTTTPTGPTGPTGPVDSDGDGVPDSSDNCVSVSNAGQADADTDGKGDACDACPADSNPGIQGCPASIIDINMGNVANGSNVRLTNVLVTAVMGDESAVWVQLKSTDPGNPGTTSYAGLEVDLTGIASPPALAAGNRVTIDGIVGTQSLTATAIIVNGTDAIEYGGATAANFANGSVNGTLNGQFVTITSATTLSSITGAGEWVTAAGFTVGKRIIGTLPACANGTNLSLFGIADLVATSLVLLPRSTDDLGAPCLTDVNVPATTCVGQLTLGSVTISAPSGSDIFVTLTSSDPTNVPVPAQVVIPNGSTSHNFAFTPAGEATATITATLNGGQTQDTISTLICP
jgi:large repetitive protein